MKDNIINYIENNKKRLTCLFVSLTINFVCIMLTYNKIFPITGTFYSVAAKTMENGAIPYRDFQLIFPPVYSYIIYFLTAIFGYNFVVIRVFGIVLFLIETMCIFFILEKLFNEEAAMLGAVGTMIMLHSSNAFTAYDYGRVLDVCFFACVLLFVNIVKQYKNNQMRHLYLKSTVLGFLAFTTVLLRQSTGCMLVVAFTICYIGLLIIFNNKLKTCKCFACYILGNAISVLILGVYLISNGALDEFIFYTFHSAIEAKGGLEQELFGWIDNAYKYMWENKIYIVFFAMWILVAYLVNKYEKKKESKFVLKNYIILSVLFIAGIIACFASKNTCNFMYENYYIAKLPFVIYFILTCMFVVNFVQLLYRKFHDKKADEKLFILVMFEGMCITFSVSGAASSTLGAQTGFITYGLIIALVTYWISSSYYKYKIINLLFVFSLMMGLVSAKLIAPYSWWGTKSGMAEEMCYEVDAPYMEGIRVALNTKIIIEEVYNTIEENKDDESTLFAFPQIPMFYLMNDIMPFTESYIQWFDVSADKTLIEDMEKIKSERPDFILLLKLPEFVLNGHETAFDGSNYSQQRIMQDELFEYVETENYYLEKMYNMEAGYKLFLYSKDEIRDDITLEYNTSYIKPDEENIITVQEETKIVLPFKSDNIKDLTLNGEKVDYSVTKKGYVSFSVPTGTHNIYYVYQEWYKETYLPIVISIMLLCGFYVVVGVINKR